MRDWDGEPVTEIIYLRVQLKPFQWEFTTAAPLPKVNAQNHSTHLSYSDFLATKECDSENQHSMMLYTKHGLDSPWIIRENYGMTLEFGKSAFIVKGDKQRQRFPELFRPTSTSAQVIDMLTRLFPEAELRTKCNDCGQVEIAVRSVQTCIRCGHDKPETDAVKRARTDDAEEKEEEKEKE